MNKTIKRGAILRATSGEHKGQFYLLVRTASDYDRDLIGNKTGCLRYMYNLVNLSEVGKARETELHRMFTSINDGVNVGVSLLDIIDHYDMDFEDVTNVASVNVQFNKVLEEKAAEKKVADLMAEFTNELVLASKLAFGAAHHVPVFDQYGKVVSFVIMNK